MVAHVSAAAAHRDTTRSTLHYAQRASAITNKVGCFVFLIKTKKKDKREFTISSNNSFFIYLSYTDSDEFQFYYI